VPRLLFEKKVDSFPKLAQELGWLDMDGGVRTFGDYQGRKRQFVFVTRSPQDTYVLMVYEKKGRPLVPGKRLYAKEFKTKQGLAKFMRSLVSKPVQAFVY